jgi:uncharacterized DUF497 family protein
MLQFDWDEDNIAHIALHQVSPQEAEDILNGELLEIDSYDVDNEVRVEEVGMTRAGRVLHIVTTIRSGRVRVVTAYDAIRSLKLAFLEMQRKYYE